METTPSILVKKLLKIVLILLAFLALGIKTASGQVLIDNSILTTDKTPYIIEADNLYPMHQVTSQSLVALKRQPTSPPTYQPLLGSGYFIRTDPKLPYYCLLTDGHNLDTVRTLSINGVETKIDLAFGVRYSNLAASRTNPTTYTTVATKTVSATIAEAKVDKKELLNNAGTDWLDYAIIKVPKLEVWGVPLMLQGIEFLDAIPTNRINADRYKSFYVIHHANLRPQQISTLNNYRVGNGVYAKSFSIRNLSALEAGSSGSPLILPLAGKPNNNDHLGNAPAIGLYSGKSIIASDFVFQKLSVIQNSLLQHCLGSLKKSDYQTSKETEKIPEKVKNASASLTNLKEGFESAINVLKAPGLIVLSGSITDATNTATKCITLTNNLAKLINGNGDKDAILQGVTELDLVTTDFIQKYGAITFGNSAKAGNNQAAYKKTTSESFGIIGDYFRYMLGLKEIVKNEKYQPNQFSIESPTSANPMQTAQIGAILENVKFSVGRGAAELRKKRESTNQLLQMQAPPEIADLHNSILNAVKDINDFYLGLKDFKSDNKDFFYGIEYFYLNREIYSNRYLQEDFYTEEYRLTEYICEVIDAEIKKTNFFSFLKEGTQSLKEIRNKLAILKGKAYPKGFITNPLSGQQFDFKHYNYVSPDYMNYIGNSFENLTWENLGLSYNTTPNGYGNKDIAQTNFVTRTEVKGAFESYIGAAKDKQSYGRWYSTKLSVWGTLDYNNIRLTYHPYLTQYLERNAISMVKHGVLYLKSTPNLIYKYGFKKENVPAEGAEFVVDFGIKQYIKDKDVTPTQAINNHYPGGVSFEIVSPELLILARAYKEVIYYHEGGDNERTEEETIEGNDQITNTLIAMRAWAEKSMKLDYSTELDGYYKWNFQLGFATTFSPGRYRIRSRSTPVAKGPPLTLQYMQPIQSSADHRRYDDLSWVESLGIVQRSVPEQIVTVVMNPDGQTYSLTHEGGQLGQYFGRSGRHYTPLVNGIYAGYMITYSTDQYGSGQNWTIRPSSTKGYYQIANGENYMTADYDPDYQLSLVNLYSLANTPEQDWAFEPVVNPSRVAEPETAERINTAEIIIPTMYPNPVSNWLTLNLPPDYERSVLTITNLSGAVLNLPIKQQGSQRMVNVQMLHPGIYFIQVQVEGKPRHTLKFLKQ